MTKDFIKYKAINHEKHESITVSAVDEEHALNIVSSTKPIGGGWNRKDVTLVRLGKQQ